MVEIVWKLVGQTLPSNLEVPDTNSESERLPSMGVRLVFYHFHLQITARLKKSDFCIFAATLQDSSKEQKSCCPWVKVKIIKSLNE